MSSATMVSSSTISTRGGNGRVTVFSSNENQAKLQIVAVGRNERRRRIYRLRRSHGWDGEGLRIFFILNLRHL